MVQLSKAGWYRLETHRWTPIVLSAELLHSSFNTLQPGQGFISPHPSGLAPFCHLPECLACVQPGWLAMSYAWHLPPLKTGHKLWAVLCLSKTRHIHLIMSSEPRMRAGPGTHWNSSYFYCSHTPRLLAFMFGDLELGFLWPAKGWHSIWACNQLDLQVLATPFPFSFSCW